MTPVRNAADEVRLTAFFKTFGANKRNGLVVITNNLKNSFGTLVTRGLGPDVGRWPPAAHADISP